MKYFLSPVVWCPAWERAFVPLLWAAFEAAGLRVRNQKFDPT